MTPGEARAAAWALKDRCYAAFATEPPQAVQAAAELQALAAAWPGEAEIAALAQWVGGIVALVQARMADAVAAFDAAADGLRAAGHPDPAAQTQVPKIMALSMLGRHDEAVACAEAAATALRALGNTAAAARVSQNLGNLLLRRDDYPGAAHHYRAAAVMFARSRDMERSVSADIGLADTQAAMGDFDEARRTYARARARAGWHGLALPAALVDESLALLDLACGRYREALAGLASACRRYEALALPQYRAIAEKQLADVYLELRLLPEALAQYEAACTRFATLALPDERAWALAQRGRALALLGAPEAEAAFDDAAALFEAQGNAVGAASLDLARAEAALARDEPAAAAVAAARARAAFDAAAQADGRLRAELVLALAQAGQGDSGAAAALHAVLDTAAQRSQRRVEVQALTGLGRLAQAAGDAALAARHFEDAIARFEAQRAALPDDALRSALLADHLKPYEGCVALALAAGDAATVLWQLERYRARSLDDRIAERGPPPDADPEQQRLRERLQWLYRRRQRFADDGAPVAALDAEVRQAEHALLEQARRRRVAEAPAVDAAQEGPDAATFAQALQGALAAGDAIVEFGAAGGRLFACVATAGGVVLVPPFAELAAVHDAADALAFQLAALRHGEAPVRAHLATLTARAEQRLARLRTLLWAPLAPALAGVPGGVRRLVVVPHGVLGRLPWGALVDDDALPLALAPSARAALRALSRPARPPRRVLALGESSRLPQAGAEAAQVAACHGGGTVRVGEAATLAALREHAAGADLVHLACHAEFRQDNPRFSRLLLADAALSADEAETLPLAGATVVLSACETGVAEVAGGDEHVGLVRAFLVAGAARVVASHWPVDDAATQAYMADFHRALATGHGPAAALRQAARTARTRCAHPALWSAFAVWGGW